MSIFDNEQLNRIEQKLDLIIKHLGIQQGSNTPATEDFELQQLLSSGRKIQAIKRYRELTGAGLKDAKNAVEKLEAKLRGR